MAQTEEVRSFHKGILIIFPSLEGRVVVKGVPNTQLNQQITALMSVEYSYTTELIDLA